ncbi:hypothetical protein F5Y06DRAFT_276020 [Hypoxylon sp. FL0890]|nr:hypothetical protein F5Y06DRAFT_276020 [Hypoxylon sp. FL0890]
MPVTEVSLFPSSTPGDIPQAFRDLAVAGIDVQGKWCVTNAPWLTRDRGAALFQQLEDPNILLITAHWDSIDQHHACIASPANQKALADLAPYMDMAAIKPGHIDGLYMFPTSEDEGLSPALEAPVLYVTICSVSKDKKPQFEEAIGKVKAVLDAFTMPYRHRGGWRIERDQGKESIEQYYLVGGSGSAEKSKEFIKSDGYDEYHQALFPLALDAETKHYKRIA